MRVITASPTHGRNDEGATSRTGAPDRMVFAISAWRTRPDTPGGASVPKRDTMIVAPEADEISSHEDEPLSEEIRLPLERGRKVLPRHSREASPVQRMVNPHSRAFTPGTRPPSRFLTARLAHASRSVPFWSR